MTLRNNNEDTVSPPQTDDMLIEDADEIRYGPGDISGEFTIPTEGEILTIPSSFDTGDEVSGYVPFEVDPDIDQPKLVIGVTGEDNDDLQWNLPTGDDVRVDLSTEIESPEDYGRLDPLEFKITVTNNGGRTARYDTTFGINGGTIEGIEGDDKTVYPISTTIDGGESITETISLTTRADPFTARFEGETVVDESTIPQIVAFGEEVEFRAANDMLGAIETAVFADEYTTEDGETVTAPSGDKFLFVNMMNENIESSSRSRLITTGAGNSFPNIELILEDDVIPMESRDAISEPMDLSPTPALSASADPGERINRYIMAEVPNDLSMSDVTIEIERYATRIRFTESGERLIN